MKARRASKAVVIPGLPLSPGVVRIGRRVAVAAAEPQAARAPATTVDEPATEAHEAARAQAVKAGHEEGLQRGLAEARTQARAALDAALAPQLQALRDQQARLDALRSSLEGQADALWAAAEDDAVALCFETICRVLGDALVTPEGLRAQIARLRADMVASHDQATVCRLHPQDLRLMDDARSQPGPRFASHGLRWAADASVALGGCVVQTSGGSIDARLETLLNACKVALLEARARRLPHQLDDGRGHMQSSAAEPSP